MSSADAAPEAVSWQVAVDDCGQRLDVQVAGVLDQPRNQVQQWIRSGRVTVDGQSAKSSLALNGGEQIEVRRPARVDHRVVPEEGALALVHEDDHFLVLDKPTGLSVHPGAGRRDGTLVHRLLHHYPEIAGVGGEGRPGIVHRLDLDTTGVIIIARTPAAYQALSRSFQERAVAKTYLAICEGHPREEQGAMTWPIGRDPNRRQQMRATERGRPARTDYRTLALAERSSLLELDLHTGRTHQIRVHLKRLGHPLLSDPVYGRELPQDWPATLRQAARTLGRPALHAWRIGFAHPLTEERVSFAAPIPADLLEAWTSLGGSPAGWPSAD